MLPLQPPPWAMIGAAARALGPVRMIAIMTTSGAHTAATATASRVGRLG
jgi:hypothetical protein